MCGRYRLSRRKQLVEEYFDSGSSEEDWSPRYNIAPTQPVPVIRQNPREPVRELALMKWGLIPFWAHSPAIATSTINAKSETAATKPAFRDPLKFPRCLIPADGFYEWQRSGKAKQPYCFEAFGSGCDTWATPQRLRFADPGTPVAPAARSKNCASGQGRVAPNVRSEIAATTVRRFDQRLQRGRGVPGQSSKWNT